MQYDDGMQAKAWLIICLEEDVYWMLIVERVG
jgi:hypothetical protein